MMTGQKKPTTLLKEEHQKVLQKLDVLEEVIHHLDKKETISAKLAELATFFKTDFWTHFAKEEEALFPEIEKFLPRQSGPLGVMLMEHDELRHTNGQLQPTIDRYLNGSDNPEAQGMIQRWGAHFIDLLRNHIAKENDILFMMADMHLDQTQIDEVIKLFGEIEESKKGGN